MEDGALDAVDGALDVEGVATELEDGALGAEFPSNAAGGSFAAVINCRKSEGGALDSYGGDLARNCGAPCLGGGAPGEGREAEFGALNGLGVLIGVGARTGGGARNDGRP